MHASRAKNPSSDWPAASSSSPPLTSATRYSPSLHLKHFSLLYWKGASIPVAIILNCCRLYGSWKCLSRALNYLAAPNPNHYKKWGGVCLFVCLSIVQSLVTKALPNRFQWNFTQKWTWEWHRPISVSIYFFIIQDGGLFSDVTAYQIGKLLYT